MYTFTHTHTPIYTHTHTNKKVADSLAKVWVDGVVEEVAGDCDDVHALPLNLKQDITTPVQHQSLSLLAPKRT